MIILNNILTLFITDGLASLSRVFVGFFIAIILGVGLGTITFYIKGYRNILKLIAEFLKSIPPIAWIPITIMFLGLGSQSAIFIVFLGGFFPIFLNTAYGVTSMPKKYTEISKNFGVNGVYFYHKILLGYLMPYILTGLKIGIGIAWTSVIASEMIGVQSGLGYYIQINRLLLNTQEVVTGMVMIGVIGYGMTKFVEKIEKKYLVWQEAKNA